jgi:hypothetical protein
MAGKVKEVLVNVADRDKPSILEITALGAAVGIGTAICMETGFCKHPDEATLIAASSGAALSFIDSNIHGNGYLRSTYDAAFGAAVSVVTYFWLDYAMNSL